MRTALLCLFAAAAAHAAASLQPRQLRCEYRTDPQGVDVADPRLSWILAPSNPNAHALRQTAYRILVASSERGLRADTGDLWDSGKVASADSTTVVYRGAALVSGAIAFWKVQVWDQDGAASNWSAPAQWTMGLLNPLDWQGKWTGRDEKGIVKDPGSPYTQLEGARWIWDADKADSSAPTGDRFFRAALALP